MTMTPTARRAGGLVGMLAAAGALVLLKGTSPSQTSALHLARHARAHVAVIRTASGDPVGSVVHTPYGPVQVQLTVRSGQIVDVQALKLPNSLSYSRQVASYAAPVLRQEVLAAQTANIDVVSGATYTSQGYAESVQAALDKLHLGA